MSRRLHRCLHAPPPRGPCGWPAEVAPRPACHQRPAACPLSPSRRPAITRVCKLWRRLFYEQPQLWQALSIQPPVEAASPAEAEQWRSGKLAMVRRVAPLLRDVQLHGCFQAPLQPGSFLLPDLLDCLDPTALRDISIRHHGTLGPAADREAAGVAVTAGLHVLAQSFPGLQALALDLRCPVPLPAAGAWALRQLGSLRQLEITAYVIPEQLVHACAAGLQQLTGLELTGFQSLPSLRQLTALAQLEALGVFDPQSGDSGLQLPSAAAFSKLASYTAHATCFAVSGGAARALLVVQLPGCVLVVL